MRSVASGSLEAALKERAALVTVGHLDSGGGSFHRDAERERPVLRPPVPFFFYFYCVVTKWPADIANSDRRSPLVLSSHPHLPTPDHGFHQQDVLPRRRVGERLNTHGTAFPERPIRRTPAHLRPIASNPEISTNNTRSHAPAAFTTSTSSDGLGTSTGAGGPQCLQSDCTRAIYVGCGRCELPPPTSSSIIDWQCKLSWSADGHSDRHQRPFSASSSSSRITCRNQHEEENNLYESLWGHRCCRLGDLDNIPILHSRGDRFEYVIGS